MVGVGASEGVGQLLHQVRVLAREEPLGLLSYSRVEQQRPGVPEAHRG